MWIRSAMGRGVAWFLLACVLHLIVPLPGFAGEGTREIRLKRGFLKNPKFTIGDEAPQPIYGFSGLSFHSSFEKVLAEHPPALRTARQALIWNGVAYVGAIGLVGASLKILLDTIQEAQDVSEGKLTNEPTDWGVVGFLAASGFVLLTGSIASNSQMRRGIALYNEHARQTACGGAVRVSPCLVVAPPSERTQLGAPVPLRCMGGLAVRFD